MRRASACSKSSRRDLVASYREWLSASGLPLPAGDGAIEIDHSQIDGPEDAARFEIQTIAEAGDVIRIAPGDSA